MSTPAEIAVYTKARSAPIYLHLKAEIPGADNVISVPLTLKIKKPNGKVDVMDIAVRFGSHYVFEREAESTSFGLGTMTVGVYVEDQLVSSKSVEITSF